MNELDGYDIEDLKIGMTARYAKTLTEADIILFAGVSGDINPIHLNEEYASTTPFGGRISHGFLTGSLISAAVANKLPGPGSVHMGMSMRFCAPVRPGDTVNVEITVRDIMIEKCRVTLESNCYVGDTLVIEGEALIKTTSSSQRESCQAVA